MSIQIVTSLIQIGYFLNDMFIHETKQLYRNDHVFVSKKTKMTKTKINVWKVYMDKKGKKVLFKLKSKINGLLII